MNIKNTKIFAFVFILIFLLLSLFSLPGLFLELGNYYYKKSNYTSAAKYYSYGKSVAILGRHKFDSNIASVDYKLNKNPEAIKTLDEILNKNLNPKDRAKVLYNKGNALYRNGELLKSDKQKTLEEWRSALNSYEDALKLTPEDKEIKENIDFVKNKIEELEGTGSDTPKKNQNNKQDNEDNSSSAESDIERVQNEDEESRSSGGKIRRNEGERNDPKSPSW